MSRDDGVGVAAGNTLVGGIAIRTTEVRCGCDDVSVSISSKNEVPDLICVLVHVGDPWRSIEGSDRKVHPSSDEMLPVAVPLGEHFLDDHGPD